MFKRTIYFIMLISLLISACSRNKSLLNMSSDVKWQTAEMHYNKGKYHKAIPYYQQLIFEKSSIYTADAQFKLGECYFNRKNYLDAIFEYQELLRLFPDHRLASDAQYKIGESYVKLSLSPEFTQDESNRAIESFNRFIEKYPNDSRIAQAYKHIADMQVKIIEKRYLTGYIYYKMKDYPASLLYLNEIIALGNRNELEKKSVFYSALIHVDRQDEENALLSIEHLRRHFPDSPELKRAQTRFNRMNSKIFRMIYFY